MTDFNQQNSDEGHDAALDQDVAVVRRAIPNAGGGTPYAAHRALDRIERRLDAGKAHAEIVEACIAAGHIEAVKP